MKKLIISNFIITNKYLPITFLIFIIDIGMNYLLEEIYFIFIVHLALIFMIVPIFIPKFITTEEYNLAIHFNFNNVKRYYLPIFLINTVLILISISEFSVIYFMWNELPFIFITLIKETSITVNCPHELCPTISDKIFNLIQVQVSSFFPILYFFIYLFILFLWAFSIYSIIAKFPNIELLSTYRLMKNNPGRYFSIIIGFTFFFLFIFMGFGIINAIFSSLFPKSIFIEFLFKFLKIYVFLWIIIGNLNIVKLLQSITLINEKKYRLSLAKGVNIFIGGICIGMGLGSILLILSHFIFISPKVNEVRAYNWNKCGNAYFLNKKYDKAIQCYNKALNLNPEMIHIYISLGNSYNMIGKYDKAIEVLERALKYNSISPYAYYNLGLSYYYKNDRKNAIKMWKKAVDLGDPYQSAKRSLKEKYGIDYQQQNQIESERKSEKKKL